MSFRTKGFLSGLSRVVRVGKSSLGRWMVFLAVGTPTRRGSERVIDVEAGMSSSGLILVVHVCVSRS